MYRFTKAPDAPYCTLAAAASGIVCAGPCELVEFEVRNNSAAPRYFMVFDHVAVPADGQAYDVMIPLLVPAGGMVTGEGQWRFEVGLCWCTSTTDLTKTIGAAEMLVSCRYRQLITP